MYRQEEESESTKDFELELALTLQSFVDDFCKNFGLQYLIDKIQELINHPVVLHDMGYKVLAKSSRAENIISFVTYDNENFFLEDETLQYLHNFQVSKKAREQALPSYFDKDTSAEGTMVAVIKINNIQIAQLAVYEAGTKFRKLDFLLIEKISQLLSIELQKDNTFNIEQNIIPNYILSNLLKGTQMSEADIRQKLHYIEWSREESFRILIISDSLKETLDRKAGPIANYLKYYIPLDNCIFYKSNIVAFITPSLYNDLFINKTDKFYDFLSTYNLKAGLSMKFNLFCECSRFYYQAIESLRVARQKDLKLASFEDIRIDILTNLMKEKYSLRDFIHPTIMILADYDKEHHLDLINTLLAYLEHLNHPNEAAKHLNIHRNTLFYRINKAKELTGITLDNGIEISQLLFSIYLYLES